MRVRRWPVIGVALAFLWLFVRGVTLTPDRLLAEFLIGLGFGVPIAFVLRRFYGRTIDVGASVRAVPYAIVYTGSFLWELLTANVEVAYLVLAPSMPIDPDVVEVPLRVESDMAITTIANSITLTPGTLTMDYDDETNTLYVHAIDGGDYDGIVEPIRAWEDYALLIFDEDADPSDPAPPRPSASRTGVAAPTDATATPGEPTGTAGASGARLDEEGTHDD
ncbi:MAG: Na+/H+ antiporter subunit E [Halorientalis sp.]